MTKDLTRFNPSDVSVLPSNPPFPDFPRNCHTAWPVHLFVPPPANRLPCCPPLIC